MVALIWIYAYLPNVMEVFIFDQSTKLLVISKHIYFYGALGIFTFLNVLIHSYRLMVTSMKSTGTYLLRENRKAIFGLWLGILQSCINITLIGIYIFYGVQAFTLQFDPVRFFALLIIGPVLVIFSFVALAILIVRPSQIA